MAGRFRLRPLNVWLEPLLMLVVLGAIVRAYFYFREFSHFPQPFFYEPFDVWMDWFNTSYWAYNKGAYDAWGTIYPPLSFVFLRVFSLASCYKEGTGYTARECDWVGLAALHAFFLANVLLLWLTFRKQHRPTAIWRSIALGLGLPSLFGLERGNLVVICFTFIILGFGPLLKSARLRWIAAGLAINFKIYIIAGLFAQLLRRRWLWFEGGLIAVVVIYMVTYALMGEGTPVELYHNIADVSGLYQAVTFLDLWYAATYKPLISLLAGQYGMISNLVGSRSADFLIILLPSLQYLVLGLTGTAAMFSWLRPEKVPTYRLTMLAFAFAMIASEPGGYTEGFLIFFVFLERWRGVGRPVAITLSYVLLLPFDIILDRVPPTVQESYLAGHATFFAYYITIGPFIRPLILQIIVIALSMVTIRDVWGDIHADGWRDRWRFRHDAPLLPRLECPVPPSGMEVSQEAMPPGTVTQGAQNEA
jgi:hypothetical protein